MRMKTRHPTRLGLAILFVLACLHAPSARSEEIVATHYGALLLGAPIAVAIERGEFQRRGVNVTGVINSVGGGTAMRNLIASGVGYAEVALPAALGAIRQGADVRIIVGGVVSVADILWVAMPNSGISSLRDLVGKRVNITAPRSSSETLALMAMEAAGIPPGQIRLVATGEVAAGLSALERGGIDAALIVEPLWSARQDRYRVAFTLENLPRMTQLVGVTTVEAASRNPERIRAIVAARRAAVDYIYAEPEAAARMVARQYGESLPVEVAIRAVRHMVEIGYWGRGNIEIAPLEAMVEGMRRRGDWSGPVDWDRIIDRSYLPEDLRS
jgi:NitT/TauT family transport system substrate-binding protein